MIVEEQLKKFEHQIKIGTFNCYQTVPKLIAEVRRLEKEADWLANMLSSTSRCAKGNDKYDDEHDADCLPSDGCQACWRKIAKRQ